jgi:hypothetical protein
MHSTRFVLPLLSLTLVACGDPADGDDSPSLFTDITAAGTLQSSITASLGGFVDATFYHLGYEGTQGLVIHKFEMSDVKSKSATVREIWYVVRPGNNEGLEIGQEICHIDSTWTIEEVEPFLITTRALNRRTYPFGGEDTCLFGRAGSTESYLIAKVEQPDVGELIAQAKISDDSEASGPVPSWKSRGGSSVLLEVCADADVLPGFSWCEPTCNSEGAVVTTFPLCTYIPDHF